MEKGKEGNNRHPNHSRNDQSTLFIPVDFSIFIFFRPHHCPKPNGVIRLPHGMEIGTTQSPPSSGKIMIIRSHGGPPLTNDAG